VNQLLLGDNLMLLRQLYQESVDLIYLDPPYNSKRIYFSTFGGNKKKAFDDNWSWGPEQVRWLNDINDRNKNVWCLLNCLMKTFKRNDGLPAYLVAMTVRLIEMHRVLKSTGSIYLHVDPTASHYLKLVMDQIFGGGNFRNEIIWQYRTGGASKDRWAQKHDVILFYAKSKNMSFNPQRDKCYTRSKSRKPGVVNYGAGTAEFFEDEGGVYNMVIARDVWDIPYINSQSAERLGYPTQKPLSLLERIIQASSNEGDVVLDPYMGSGTTIEAAAKLGRNWIGMDLNEESLTITKKRINSVQVLKDLQPRIDLAV